MTKAQVARNLWITRKARIKASERLLSLARLSNIVLPYYSASLIVVTITSETSLRSASTMLLGLSVFLLAASLYFPALKLEDRAEAFKKVYTSLQLLGVRLDCIQTESPASLAPIMEEYIALLRDAENHSWFDFLQTLREAPDERLSVPQWIGLSAGWAWRLLLLAIVLAVPVAAEVKVLGWI